MNNRSPSKDERHRCFSATVALRDRCSRLGLHDRAAARAGGRRVQTPPSERVNVAGIGAGGMGGGDIATHAKNWHEHRALCRRRRRARPPARSTRFPGARYKDFREMIDKEAKNIDAVTRRHARPHPRRGRDGRDPRRQARLLPEAAHPHAARMPRADQGRPTPPGVATQMGNQGHATEGARLTNEWIQAGRDRRGARGPRLVRSRGQAVEAGHRPARPKRRRCPTTLDWDLWLGPVPERPYHPAYVPVDWRGWWDFGTGALGDMGCHIIDHPVWALELGAPDHGRVPHDARRLACSKATSPTSRPIRSRRSSTTSSPRAATCRRCA